MTKTFGGEYTRFNKTSQRLADQTRMISKKDWFSDLEILEISAQVNNKESEQDPPNRIEIQNT